MPPPASAFNTFPPDTPKAMQKPRLLDRVRAVARMRHLSLRTKQAYSDWIRRCILLHRKRHPEQMGADEIRLFLSHLAVEGRVAASAQNVALCALLFLYRDVLRVDLPYVEGIQRVQRPARVPVVFTRGEVSALMAHLPGTYKLIAGHLRRAGLRLLEALRLRVKDLDFDYTRWRASPVRPRGVGVAARLPLGAALHGSALGGDAPPPRLGRQRAAEGEEGAPLGRPHEARGLSHAAAQLRHSPPGGRLRPADDPGTSRALGRADDANLHARTEQMGEGSAQPASKVKEPKMGYGSSRESRVLIYLMHKTRGQEPELQPIELFFTYRARGWVAREF